MRRRLSPLRNSRSEKLFVATSALLHAHARHRDMLPAGTRFLGSAPADRPNARKYSQLSRLLPSGAYHTERNPEKYLNSGSAPTPLNSEASHALPVGWEQRVERHTSAAGSGPNSGMARIFFIDHTSRATTLVDPRVSGTGAGAPDAAGAETASDELREILLTDAMRELLLLASGVLPEQAVSAADFRAAMHRALRQTLSELSADRPAVTGGLRERRLQLQQHIGRALLERYLGAGQPPSERVENVQAHFARKHSYPLGLQNLDQHVMSSLMKHAFTGDLLSLYTSGFLGPKRRHIWRVHNRLDALQPAALRNYTGSFSNGKPRALSGAPEPLTSSLENAITGLLLQTSGQPTSATSGPTQPNPDGWWLCVQSLIALTEVTGSVGPLLHAVNALLGPNVPSPPPPPSSPNTPDGAASGRASAPGMGYRLGKLYRAFALDLANALSTTDAPLLSASWDWRLLADLSGGMQAWRASLGLPPPPEVPASALQAASADEEKFKFGSFKGFGSEAKKRQSLINASPPELTPDLTPSAAAASLLAAIAGYASPMEDVLLGPPPSEASLAAAGSSSRTSFSEPSVTSQSSAGSSSAGRGATEPKLFLVVPGHAPTRYVALRRNERVELLAERIRLMEEVRVVTHC